MSKFAAAALVATISAQEKFLVDADLKKSVSAMDVVDVIEGFLEGAVAAEGLTDLDVCIKDAEHMVPTLQKTYNDCKAGSIDSMLDCVKDLADVAKEAKHTVSDCGHLEHDQEKLDKIIKVMKHPLSFTWKMGKALVVNGVNIYHDIERAIDAYHTKSWKDFGKNIGDATALVIFGEETKKAFLKGGVYYVNPDAQDPEDILVPMVGNKNQFPKFSSLHAHCEITVPADMACDQAYNALKQLTDKSADTANPAGKYNPKEDASNDFVWTVRTTANGKYKDDVIFEFNSASGEAQCNIHARSQSQSLSMLDNNVNFCNMFNIIKQVNPTIATGDNYKVGECKMNQSDFTQCGRY